MHQGEQVVAEDTKRDGCKQSSDLFDTTGEYVRKCVCVCACPHCPGSRVLRTVLRRVQFDTLCTVVAPSGGRRQYRDL